MTAGAARHNWSQGELGHSAIVAGELVERAGLGGRHRKEGHRKRWVTHISPDMG
jgi:hypothetical protein